MDVVLNHCCEELNEQEKYGLLNRVIEEYEKKESNLIQILHLAQVIFGSLPMEVQRFIAKEMNLPLSKVNGVVTFYSFFSTKPKGQHVIRVCLGTACYVRGGKKVLTKLKELLAIDVGETTEDRLFTLEVMRCIGACGLAPSMTINDQVYQRLTPDKLQKILEERGYGRE
jgi:NADH:ubiquinone oxidoreductase subunit E